MSRTRLRMHREATATKRITQLIPGLLWNSLGKPASIFGHLLRVLPKAIGSAPPTAPSRNQCLAGATCDPWAKMLTDIRLTRKQGYARNNQPLGTGSTACLAARISAATRYTWKTWAGLENVSTEPDLLTMLDGDAKHASVISTSRAQTRLMRIYGTLFGSLTCRASLAEACELRAVTYGTTQRDIIYGSMACEDLRIDCLRS